MSGNEEDEVPTVLPSLRHAHVVGAEPPAQVTESVREAPAATTGLDGVIVQLDGTVTPVPESTATDPVMVLQRVS